MNRRTAVICLSLLAAVTAAGCGRASDRGAAAGNPDAAGTGPADRSAAALPEPPLHPAFTLTGPELEAALGTVPALPDRIRGAILADPPEFLGLLAKTLETDPGLLVLVDKRHELSSEYEPDDLVRLAEHGFNVNRSDLRLRSVVIPDLSGLTAAAREAGFNPPFISAYRSYEYQVGVYARHIEVYGREAAERESAQAGKSQHQLGTVFDIGSLEDDFGTTPGGRWLLTHAWEYGFSLSYPDGYERLTGYKYEPWHYRYIGPDAAALERRFFEGVQQYLLEFLHAAGETFRAARTAL